MRLLLYSWKANNEQILADNMMKAGFEVIWFHKECQHYTRDMELAMEMIPFIHAQGIEVVVSFNYFPIISMICNTCQIPYYAWVYDCPHFTLFAKQITMPCNHIGIFDREMVRQLKNYGVNTAYHVPLAADAVYFEKIIVQASRQEKEKYQCDISFVGSLYTGDYNYYDNLFFKNYSEEADTADGNGLGHEQKRKTACAEEIKNGMSAELTKHSDIGVIIKRQCFSYQKDCLRQAVTDGDIDFSMLRVRMEKEGLMLGEDYFAKPEDILLAAVLEKKVTVEERRILLTEIAKRFACNNGGKRAKAASDGSNSGQAACDSMDRANNIDAKFDFKIFTGSDTENLPELAPYNYGMVDYQTQMPLVFAGSKINLNISLRSIHSGIPLRVLDIMACGGFVLSNWQPEISEYFEEGAEIVTFDSLEDCLDKIEYYLIHEEERRQIAANGQRKVQERFSYQIGLEKLFR